jgi:dGTPase
MSPYGGFEHNLQSLRTVDLLEERYGAFNGLNLMYETREGVLKHCSPRNARVLGEIGARFLENSRPSLEAQICNLADEIAYNSHDVDDGLRSGLLNLRQMEEIDLFGRHAAIVRELFPGISERKLIHETIRHMIDAQVTDLLAESMHRIASVTLHTLHDVHQAPDLIGFGETMAAENRQLKTFLRAGLYRHFEVQRMTTKARKVIRDLFTAFHSDPGLLPPQYQRMAEEDSPRAIADYIAGMTDRYAVKEHRRLFAIWEP